ncbi:MAG: MOSC N-terminal beta barrel domain-containing protein [Proteobacteria bacterium]|nr:MOSC N-terminal beta barrel domain-containing protein [Pseudomonadota bacterium]
MKVGIVQEIHRYPVKSMAGEALQEVRLGTSGLPGDRAWAVRDEKRGGIRGAKKIPQLMGLRARYAKPPAAEGSSPAEITLPDGTTLETGASDVNERLSQALDHPVSLWPLLPAEALDHYRRGAPTHDDLEAELRAMFGREPGEPLPDLGLFPPELLEFESPPGTYFDAFPLLLLTERALEAMGEKAPGSRFDVRRFRPNFLLSVPSDTSGTDTTERMPELAWRGGRLQIGEAVVRVSVECPRCVMVTHGFHGLPKDPSIMRSLVRETGGNLGVYASIETPGTVRVGDTVALTTAR